MKIKINGVLVEDTAEIQPIYNPLEITEMENKVKEHVQKFGKIMVPAAAFIGALNITTQAFAATPETSLVEALNPLIQMVQDLAFPVGIVVASWGLIEVMVGQPNGKQKIKLSLIGYIGMYLIPTLFRAIRDGFGGL